MRMPLRDLDVRETSTENARNRAIGKEFDLLVALGPWALPLVVEKLADLLRRPSAADAVAHCHGVGWGVLGRDG